MRPTEQPLGVMRWLYRLCPNRRGNNTLGRLDVSFAEPILRGRPGRDTRFAACSPCRSTKA